MDPASVLGLVSSIAGLIETTVKIISYVNDVQNAPTERAQLARHASSLLAMLTDLRYRVEEAKSTSDAWFTALRGLGVSGGPLDQLRDQLELLATKLDPPRGRLQRVGRALTWTLDKKEIEKILEQIEHVEMLVMLALQNDHFKLSLEMKQDLIDVKGDLRGAIDGATAARQVEEFQKVTAWLSSLDFAVKQVDFVNRRQVGTGEWFLSDPRFQQWLTGEERTLWCPGLPGAGKTILSSMVVDWLESQHQGTDTAVIYLYCNYKEEEIQTAQNLIGSLLKQAVQHRPSALPADVLSLYNKFLEKKTGPRLDELSRLLAQEVNTYSQVFVVIDALDECPEGNNTRGELLTEIQKLPSNARILITSRYSPKIDEGFENVPHIEIRATNQDVELYVKGRIEKERSLAAHVLRDRPLTEEVIETVVERSRGMFLLAQFHMDNLAKSLNRRELRQALDSLPEELDEIYEQAMLRIKNQDERRAALAYKVLYWISYSLRPLTVMELQHALAVEPGDDDLDEDGLYEPELMVSVCAGLVTVDEESHQIRLVHYTTQSYFERTRITRFPEALSTMAKACLTYLSFRLFAEKYCSETSEVETRLSHYPFLRYAASYWEHHVRDGMDEDIHQLALRYLSNNISILNTIQASERVESRFRLKWYVGTNFTRLHTVAWFGLVEIARDLLVGSVNLNARAYENFTPLHMAAERGHTQMVSLLLQAGAEVSPRTFEEETPLHIAAGAGHHSVVQVLIDAGADCNDCMPSGRLSPLHVALEYGHIDVARVLIENGADVSQKHVYTERTPLIQAVEHGHEALVLLLLNNGADISAAQKGGLTALHAAARSGQDRLVEMLISRGSDVSIQGEGGETALHYAARFGYDRLVEMLILRGIDISIQDKEGKTALHHAAENENGDDSVVEMLISRGIDISIQDKEGKTALHYVAGWGQAGLAQLLLKSEANPLTEDNEGTTAIHEAAMHKQEEVLKLLLEHVGKGNETERWLATTRLREAVDQAKKGEVRSLLEKGADPNFWENSWVSLLHLAIVREDADVLQLLLTNQANVSVKDYCGRTALHWAAFRNYDVGVRLLLEHGADTQATDDYGITPLHFAAAYGSASVVKRLLDNGSLLNAKDKKEQTALAWFFRPDLLSWNPHMIRKNDLLPEEEREDEEQRARRYPDILDLLIEKGADLNEPLPTWNTILLLAAESWPRFARVPLIQRALEAGADVAEQNEDGKSALYLAAVGGDVEAVRLLLEHGADPNQRNKRNKFGPGDHDEHGTTALHEAAQRGNVEMARLLIEAGADAEAADEDGNTVLHEAVNEPAIKKGATPAIIDLLLAQGVDINAHYGGKKATVLHHAVMKGDVATVQFLLERGANIAATDVEEMTALDWAKESGHEAMIFVLSRHSTRT
ncbi:uncharacterized protein Z520_05601 [Fonsecaea multimorphosa CBS 102226]|uniref:NACHT domain-containing protein n=1 Tax=Fonsecaea multimorphosa CBS 102226 TaxID=1442371 RepID=A0A0D2H8V8_9EURO|nr:uncharacterized protein Z520_05601 [Fonsecaea multimorphosa CBS 102226]KIX98300.1 hypothetical protein Z520_05601 [Fonsecaea multimorphosa CBS 102226]